jgi:HEAT repeat protein
MPAVDPPVRPLDSPDPECRREAALGLDGVAEAVPALLGRLEVETDAAVRDAILTTLVGHDTPAVAAGLAGHLASEDPGLRTAAAQAMAALPGSVPALIPDLLADPDHDVRIMIVMVLADLRHPEADAWLVAMIRDDPHPNVVTAAIGALLPSAGAEHVTLLRHALQRFPGDPFLRFLVETAVPPLTGTTK